MPEYENLLNEYDELAKNNSASSKSGSAFGALDNNKKGDSPLNNIKKKAGSATMQAMGVPKPLANMAANKLGKNNGLGNTPNALKNRRTNMPGLAPGRNPNSLNTNKDTNAGESNSKSSNSTSNPMNSMMNSNQNQEMQEKSTVQRATEGVATKGASTAMQAMGVPKFIADGLAKKFGEGPGLKILLIGIGASIFLFFFIIILIIYLWFLPVLKGLELIGDVKEGMGSFMDSAENWFAGNGWCANEAECEAKAEEKFYAKVKEVSEDKKNKNIDMALVMASVLYGYNPSNGMFDAGNSDYCQKKYENETDQAKKQEEIKKCEAQTAEGTAGTDEYKEAKENLSKVANKLRGGVDKFDNYMVTEFIPNNYSDMMKQNNRTAEQILKEIYVYSSFFDSYRNKKSKKSYISTVCPGGITVLAGSDSDRYPGATNLSLEEYVAGSLSSEYNYPSEPEVMKAVAVAIRSYFVAHINNGGSCTVKNTTNFQTYREPTETTIQIAEETAGQVIMYNEKVIGLHYSIFPGNSADGWSSSTPCENSVCTDGMCTAMLYKDPNNEKTYLTIPQSYGGYSDVSSINNSHCHGMSTLVASYLESQSYNYEAIIKEFVSDGVEITTMASGEQTMPLVLPDPINWRNYTSRTYQIGTATCFREGEANGTGCNHLGIDFSYWGIGGTPILAIAPGTVVISTINFSNKGYGNNVLLGHDMNGDGDYDYYSRYAHMRNEPEVSVGQVVDAGTQLGLVGTTGSSTGDHLHFELYSAAYGRDGNDVSNFYATQPEDRIDMLARGEVWYE